MAKRSILKQETFEQSDGTLVAYYGLSYANGNKDAYFTATATWKEKGSRRRDVDEAGCLHERILKASKRLSGIVALHHSYESGEPMYAVENGVSFLEGALGINKYPMNQTPAQCEEIALKHFRCTKSELAEVKKDFAHKGKQAVSDFCETMRPLWAIEANAVKTRLGLL